MFPRPAWAVGSYRSGQTAARTVGITSTGGFHHCQLSPCTVSGAEASTGFQSSQFYLELLLKKELLLNPDLLFLVAARLHWLHPVVARRGRGESQCLRIHVSAEDLVQLGTLCHPIQLGSLIGLVVTYRVNLDIR